jgi:hypothetical protein
MLKIVLTISFERNFTKIFDLDNIRELDRILEILHTLLQYKRFSEKELSEFLQPDDIEFFQKYACKVDNQYAMITGFGFQITN